MQEESRTLITPEGHKITFRHNETSEIKINLSPETVTLLEHVASKKGLSVESVIKFFISKGLREAVPEQSAKLAVEKFRSRNGGGLDSKIDLAA